MTKRTSTLNLAVLLGHLCIVAMVMAASCSSGGGGGTGEASKAANAAHDAYRATDWTTYAQALHPDGLDRYQSILRPMVESAIQVDSTGAVADSFQWLGRSLNTQEFMNMSAAEFFAFSMTEILTAVPQLQAAMSSAEIEILGETVEGDTLVHVVVRTSAEAMGIGMSEVSVLTTKKHEGVYRVMLSGQLEGLITAIAQNMGPR
ncbi:MAG: hypothetical protein OEV49_04700 [candidate division Zixibacteria bacterium]|nr:hypothetical protein [candidate division Zixibacteria bacterium]MDH3938640.1 hypothetical protein [candidate division Zixibacteria bacterium]MDH4032407.1 hypothetical protein [candidate division Zixibacteria bacterium]